MSRLTEKGTFFEIEKHYQDTRKGNVIDKLGKLEDLEDELGCPLDVVFKALRQGHIFVDMNTFEHDRPILQDIQKKKVNFITFNGTYFCIGYTHDYEVALNDYGKTWWLKEDRSE